MHASAGTIRVVEALGQFVGLQCCEGFCAIVVGQETSIWELVVMRPQCMRWCAIVALLERGDFSVFYLDHHLKKMGGILHGKRTTVHQQSTRLMWCRE